MRELYFTEYNIRVPDLSGNQDVTNLNRKVKLQATCQEYYL